MIASKVNSKTGKFNSDNCYGEEKIKRFKKAYPNQKIKEFYTDSLSDLPMINFSEKGYVVSKNNIELYQGDKRCD